MWRRLFALAGLLVLACVAPATAQAEKRVALVVGNAAYQHLPPLRDADQDAAATAAALERLGFSVISALNADLATLRGAIAKFQRDAAGADAALVFYSGHALRYRGGGYLVPVNATLKDETSVEWDTLQLQQALDALPRSKPAFVIIDGCGQGVLASALEKQPGVAAAAASGFGAPPARPDALTILSTSAKDAACDSSARSSLLPRALLSEIDQPGLDAGQLFERVRQIVSRRSGGRQDVEFAGAAPRGFRFANADLPDAAFRRLGADPAPADLRGFIQRYAEHPFASLARAMLAAKEQRPAAQQASGVDPWRGMFDEQWRSERQSKARAARFAALEARWNREEGDRQIELAAIEERKLAQERADREKSEREDRARQLREQEDERRRQADAAIAEQRRQVEVALQEKRRQEQERADREKTDREDKARLVREQEEQRRKQAELAVQERAERERAEREQRIRIAREQEEQRKRQAEQESEDRRRAEEQRLALLNPTQPQQRQTTVRDVTSTPVPAGGQAVDEATRFTNEQRRLAQERMERERRGRGLPDEFTSPLPSETTPPTQGGPGSAPSIPPLANLSPAIDKTTPETPLPKAGTPEFIKASQEELKRLGCYAGTVHGRMNNGTKAALESAAKKIGASFQAEPLTEDGLRNLKAQPNGLCAPVACGPGQTRRGDICVASRPPAAREEEPARRARAAPAPQRRVVSKPAPAQPASSGGSRGGCFTFNGRQYCQ